MNVFSVRLTDRFISIEGVDAIKFLQGQASCDLNALSSQDVSFGTLNTPKGRMYCLFKVIKTESGLLLSMNESILESTLQKLSKYAVFFKCELKEEPSYHAYGITCPDESDYSAFLSEKSLDKLPLNTSSEIEGKRWLNISSVHRIGELWIKEDSSSSTISTSSTISLEHWHALETQAGIPALYSESQEEFILQSLNLHQLGAVSFKKGCYTGQEIIARMKFLGKQKKQTYLLHSKDQFPLRPLSSVYNGEGKKCGTIIRSHTTNEFGTLALAILPIQEDLTHPNVFLDEKLGQSLSVSEIDYSEFKK